MRSVLKAQFVLRPLRCDRGASTLQPSAAMCTRVDVVLSVATNGLRQGIRA